MVLQLHWTVRTEYKATKLVGGKGKWISHGRGIIINNLYKIDMFGI